MLKMYISKKDSIKLCQKLCNKYVNTNLDVDGLYGANTKKTVDDALAETDEETKETKKPGTRHFNLKEYYSNRYDESGKKLIKVDKPPITMYPYIQKSMDRLEILRARLNKKYGIERHEIVIEILSAVRLPEYEQMRIDKGLTTTKNSAHKRGTATDIKVPGLSPKQVYEVALEVFKDGGVGLYKTFVHMDLDHVAKRPYYWKDKSAA